MHFKTLLEAHATGMLYTLHILTTDKAARAVRQRIAFRLVVCISLLYKITSKHSFAQDNIMMIFGLLQILVQKNHHVQPFFDYPASDEWFSVKWLL